MWSKQNQHFAKLTQASHSADFRCDWAAEFVVVKGESSCDTNKKAMSCYYSTSKKTERGLLKEVILPISDGIAPLSLLLKSLRDAVRRIGEDTNRQLSTNKQTREALTQGIHIADFRWNYTFQCVVEKLERCCE
jgi:hypothetical protein